MTLLRRTLPVLVAAPLLLAPALGQGSCGLLGSRPDGNPSVEDIACRLDAPVSPGRFGRIEYADVPVYQPATPLPGTHTVGVPGLPAPREGESFEQWEWRLLQSSFDPERLRVRNEVTLVHPRMADRLLRLERAMAREEIPFRRLETWRDPSRQAYLFQRGRARPGSFATATLTSWHTYVDEAGRPAALAADYSVPWRHQERFHALAAEVGLSSFGADSNDPGHVFFPAPALARTLEAPLIRLLPRVPVVTLETGRPRDELWTTREIDRWRRLSHRYARTPFDGPGAILRASEPALPVRPGGR